MTHILFKAISVFSLSMLAVTYVSAQKDPTDVYMGMTREELRENITKIRAERKGVEPSEVSFPIENNGYIEVVVEKYGQPGERVVSSKVVSSEETQYTMPSATDTVTMPSNQNNYTISSGSDMLSNIGSTEGLGHRYAPPMEGLVNFATNTPWVHIDGEQKVEKRED